MVRPTFGGSLIVECGFGAIREYTECDDLLPTKAAGERD